MSKKDIASSPDQEGLISIDMAGFEALVGEDILKFLLDGAPRKVHSRIISAARHYELASKLHGIDEEMGAIRLIAGEEELVVAIFEWLKLNEDHYPEHKHFVRKFKNHLVKLTFYPVLMQFSWIVGDMLTHGFSLEGLEDLLHWRIKPVIDGTSIKLMLYNNDDGKEIIKHDPLSTTLNQGDVHGADVVPLLLADLAETVQTQLGKTLRQYFADRADFRNQLLYATDGGIVAMHDSLTDLVNKFNDSYRALLWVLALIIGGQPPSKEWGLASQFIGVYHAALIEAGVLPREDNQEQAV